MLCLSAADKAYIGQTLQICACCVMLNTDSANTSTRSHVHVTLQAALSLTCHVTICPAMSMRSNNKAAVDPLMTCTAHLKTRCLQDSAGTAICPQCLQATTPSRAKLSQLSITVADTFVNPSMFCGRAWQQLLAAGCCLHSTASTSS